jgi:hypothetical protein
MAVYAATLGSVALLVFTVVVVAVIVYLWYIRPTR